MRRKSILAVVVSTLVVVTTAEGLTVHITSRLSWNSDLNELPAVVLPSSLVMSQLGGFSSHVVGSVTLPTGMEGAVALHDGQCSLSLVDSAHVRQSIRVRAPLTQGAVGGTFDWSDSQATIGPATGGSVSTPEGRVALDCGTNGLILTLPEDLRGTAGTDGFTTSKAFQSATATGLVITDSKTK